MKYIVCMVSVMLFVLSSFSQQTEKYFLPIATDKTVSLIFPFKIRYVDRGSKDVLVQQIDNAQNLLLVKAANTSLQRTNLSVVTADGKLYAFEILYDKNLKVEVHH